MDPHPLAETAYFLRFTIALLLGVAIGLEREWRQRMAGLHTTALVAAGSAMFAMIAPLMETNRGDPTRIAAQVVSGIGFLAGGVILRQGANVRGLTTAATIWASAAVGVLVGFGFLQQAAGATVAIIVANLLLEPLTRFMESIKRDTRNIITTYDIKVTCNVASKSEVRERIIPFVSGTQFSLTSVKSTAAGGILELIDVQLTRSGRDDRSIERLARDLEAIRGVTATQWQATGTYV